MVALRDEEFPITGSIQAEFTWSPIKNAVKGLSLDRNLNSCRLKSLKFQDPKMLSGVGDVRFLPSMDR